MQQEDKRSIRLSAGLARLYRQATPRRRHQLAGLLLLMIVGGLAEIVSLGAVMPFLALLANPNDAPSAGVVGHLAALLGWTRPEDLVVPATAAFIAAALVSGSLRLLLAWAGNKFILRVGHELMVQVYSNTLRQPYGYHVRTNTSVSIASIAKVQAVTTAIMLPILEAAVAVLISAFILVTLFIIDPIIACSSAFGFGTMYVAVSRVTRRRLRDNSRVIAAAETERVKVLQEGIGGIRDVIIDRVQHVYLSKFSRASLAMNDCRTNNLVIAASPRFVMETFGLVMIAVLAAALTRNDGGLSGALPTLGALALGAQKLLPLLQRIYQGWAQASGNAHILADVLEKLDLPVPDVDRSTTRPLEFEHSLSFRKVSFSYGEGVSTLVDIDLDIEKGTHLGVVGPTGSGKSTLIDLILGLLEPSSGAIQVDGERLDEERLRAWQRNVAHVPQSIYLSDASIAENIAFGVAPVDIRMEFVREIAERVHLRTFIEGLPDGYMTQVGERGVRLSGGQRQRIGIARALYKQASVLVLDEATSALDSDTEASVMSAIEELRSGLTIITIAHRETTLQHCDKVIRIEAGRIVESGTYQDVIIQAMGRRD